MIDDPTDVNPETAPGLTLAEARHRFDDDLMRGLDCSLHHRPVTAAKAVFARLRPLMPPDALFTARELVRANYKRAKTGLCLYIPPKKKEEKDFDLSCGAALWFSQISPILYPDAYIRAFWREVSNREMARQTGISEHTIRRKLGDWYLKRVSRV